MKRFTTAIILILTTGYFFSVYSAAEDFVPEKTKSDSAFELFGFVQQVSTSSGAQALLAIALVLLVGLLMFYYGLARILPVLAVVLVLGGLGLGVWKLSQPQEPTISKAGAKESPKNIVVEVVDTSSVRIMWQTDIPAISAVYYGSDKKEMDLTSFSDTPDERVSEHEIILDGLIPGNIYYYEINSNGILFRDESYFFEF